MSGTTDHSLASTDIDRASATGDFSSSEKDIGTPEVHSPSLPPSEFLETIKAPRWWESKSYEEKPLDGAYGWAVVCACSMMLMFSMGCVNSYGSYQTYYHINQFPKEPMSTLSWIGTLQMAVMNLFGIPSGILCERLDSRLVTFTGGVIMGLSLIIASFCDGAVWKLLITQGIVFGMGASLVFIPATSIPSQWFVKNRPLAIGIVVAGGGIGGLWLTPATDHLITSMNTAWALRITGIIIIAINSACSIVVRNRYKVPPRDKIVDLAVLKDTRFLFLFAGTVCGTTGYFTPFFYMPSFAHQVAHTSVSFGTNLITIINAASTLGRILTGQAAMQLGNINTLLSCTIIAALSILVLWLPFHSAGTLVACAVVYGMFCGGFISLTPVILADIWGVSRISTIVGLLYIASSVGTIVGAPSSGAILDNIGRGVDFKPNIAFSGAFMMGAFLFFCGVRVATTRLLLSKV
ncbi:MFS general substrate transporter [Martensiomyces pterosporus]|nr:MFS general substrate transporter [Martensiomyces pterosporus]